MRASQKIETFQDGYIEIYKEEGRKITQKKGVLPFEEQSVGVNRYYKSNIAIEGSRIDRMVKVPKNPITSRLDVVTVSGEDNQYRINRIQEKPERGVLLLELQSVQVMIDRGGANRN